MANQHTVTIEPSKLSFVVGEDETILGAAKAQGINLPHSCLGGFCSACKVQTTSGTVEHEDYDAKYALTPEDSANGKILTCRAKAKSDVTIDLPGYSADDLKQQIYNTRVAQIEHIHDVAIIRLDFQKDISFSFKAGQYIDVIMPDNRTRSYSIANAAVDSTGFLELHIRAQKNGAFSTYVFNHMQVGHMVQVRGPLGSFIFETKQDNKKPIIFLASGTGFAPVKSMIETLIGLAQTDRTIYFYWGARKKNDLYMQELAERFALSLPRYYFVPVLSDSAPEDNWTGRTGLVHEAILKDFNDLGFYEVYACGAPEMIKAAVADLTTKRNLPETSFFSDAFTPSTVKA